MRLLDLGAGAGKAGPVNFRGEVARVVGVDPDWAIAGKWPRGFVGRSVVAECLPFRAEQL